MNEITEVSFPFRTYICCSVGASMAISASSTPCILDSAASLLLSTLWDVNPSLVNDGNQKDVRELQFSLISQVQ